MNITLVMTNYLPDTPVGGSRFNSALRTLESWKTHLHYNTGQLRLLLINSCGDTLYSRTLFDLSHDFFTTEHVAHEGGGVGVSLNIAFDKTFAFSGLAFYAADDWALTGPLDLTPWATLLEREKSIGMVRLGPPHADLTGTVRMFPEGWGLQLDRHHYAFGHRPALYHPRMRWAYGYFAEKINALECERLYNEAFCRSAGPEILLALPHPWNHVGETEVGDLEP